MSVGDVNSSERGSGARYNDGKPDLSLIPLTIVAASLDGGEDPLVQESLNLLGLFQTTGNGDYLTAALNSVGEDWRDCARVFEYGKKKYAAWNWAKGMAWSIPLACAARHALAILEGEEIDSESGLPHVGHYMANLVMLAHFVRFYPEGNDLPPPELFRGAATLETKRAHRVDEYAERVCNPTYLVDPSGKTPPVKLELPISRYSAEGIDEVLSPPHAGRPEDCRRCKQLVAAKFPPFTL
jgi:hypothetical protein